MRESYNAVIKFPWDSSPPSKRTFTTRRTTLFPSHTHIYPTPISPFSIFQPKPQPSHTPDYQPSDSPVICTGSNRKPEKFRTIRFPFARCRPYA
ncbi:hypothetical protein NPIL_583431 [Nephila pilipes]|uniref:Uncharacterized protein n=1 Tax=Nephila pilipes TaxID=299642 RepID=A0A8X6Q5D6_NEPPI|nr:hypothetical protein NPIL_583431 [Nephila pilipes]